MAVLTDFSASRLRRLLRHYDVGELVSFGGLPEGRVQTNLWVETTRGRYAFRYYEDRLWSRARVEADAEILVYLTEARFPCPAPIPRKGGGYVGTHDGKLYSLFTFLDGEHADRLSLAQAEQVAGVVADLHLLTEGYRPRRTARRSFGRASLTQDARKRAEAAGTPEATAKLEWLMAELDGLVLPRSLPRGLCHGDLTNRSNLLFREGQLTALLDWDDANYTYLIVDLADLLNWHCWPHGGGFAFAEARATLCAYEARRELSAVERRHLYDACKLETLLDCCWLFSRDVLPDEYLTQKRMIEALEAVGREGFYERVFG
jgi:homoserine kinase type II